MVYIRSRKFCFCLPVRFGVFCESILGFLISGAFAFIAFFLLNRFKNHLIDVSHTEEIALWVLGGTMTVFVLTSLLGLAGAIWRQRNLVQIYAGFLTFVTVLNIGGGVFAIYQLFHGAGASELSKCKDAVQSNMQVITDVTNFACNSAFKAARVVVVVVYVVFWLIEIYGCVIAFEYVSQLEEEEDANLRGGYGGEKGSSSTNVTIVQAAPAPVPQPSYGFAAPQKSYGRA